MKINILTKFLLRIAKNNNLMSDLNHDIKFSMNEKKPKELKKSFPISLVVFLCLLGIFFGSFFTLAVYRIPRKEDILIKHSYCPNCNHKLGFFDLFPVLSYIFLLNIYLLHVHQIFHLRYQIVLLFS